MAEETSTIPREGRHVAAFVWARWHTAAGAPSRDHLGLLMLAIKVAHRRARRALERIFDDSEDSAFKRELLLTYASLDQQMNRLLGLEHLDRPDELLQACAALLQTIDGVFGLGVAACDLDVDHLDVTLADHPAKTLADRPAALEDVPTTVWVPNPCSA